MRKGMLTYSWMGRRGRQQEDTKTDLPEKPRKYDDDAVDAVRYGVAGAPRYIPRPQQHSAQHAPPPEELDGYIGSMVDYG